MFNTNMEQQIIVCNPLTKRLKTYDARTSSGQQAFHRFAKPGLKVRATWQCSSPATTHITGHPLPISLTDMALEIQTYLTKPDWFFFLSVSIDRNRRITLALDTRSDAGWTTITDLPEDFCFFANWPIELAYKCIAVGFSTHAGRFRVLMYNLYFKFWQWARALQRLRDVLTLAKSVEKVFIVTTASPHDHWRIFAIEDKARLTRKDVEPPLQASSERVWAQMVLGVPDRLLGVFLDCYTSSSFSLFCIGQEGIAVYYVGVRGDLISVLRYSNGDSLEFTLNWEFRKRRLTRVLELGDFHIFRPSLSLV